MASANSEPIRFYARRHHPIAIGDQRVDGAAGGGELAEQDEQADILVDVFVKRISDLSLTEFWTTCGSVI